MEPEIYPASKDEIKRKLDEQFHLIRNYAFNMMSSPWEFVQASFNLFGDSGIVGRLAQKEGDLAVLDQGCGDGTTLCQLMSLLEKEKKNRGKLLGIGVAAGLKHVLANMQRRNGKKEFTAQEVTKPLHSSSQQFTNNRRALIEFIDEDLHFLDLPQKFDLIYARYVYIHLVMPFLALGKACNSLNDGGLLRADLFDEVAPISIYEKEGRKLSSQIYLSLLREMNPQYQLSFSSLFPSLVIEKKCEADFELGLSVGKQGREGNLCYLIGRRSDFLFLDDLIREGFSIAK